MKKGNVVLCMFVIFVAAMMFNGCGIIYHGVYSGKAPNSVYRGDNQGTPGLRVQPMEFQLTQEQLANLSDQQFETLMDRLDRYNESMREASYSEGYDAAMKSGWTRRNIGPPAPPQSIPSSREMRELRRAELEARSQEFISSERRPPPRRADFHSEQEFRRAYKQWMISN